MESNEEKGRITMNKNVIVAVFAVESEGFQTLAELRQAAAGETYSVSAASLVRKDGDSCTVLDGFDTGKDTLDDELKGGLIGMLVGILGGPLGVLLGGSVGSLVGLSRDAGDEALGLSMLGQISDKLDDGMVALVALADEESPDAVDAILSSYETIIARFDAKAVVDEVKRAYEQQAEIERLAKLEKEKQETEELKASVKEGAEKFKSDMEFVGKEIKDTVAEFGAEMEAQHEKDMAELEENSEILRKGFSK